MNVLQSSFAFSQSDIWTWFYIIMVFFTSKVGYQILKTWEGQREDTVKTADSLVYKFRNVDSIQLSYSVQILMIIKNHQNQSKQEIHLFIAISPTDICLQL